MYLRIVATTDGKNRRKKFDMAVWPIFEGGHIELGNGYIFHIDKISVSNEYTILSNSNYIVVCIIEE